MIFCKKRNNLAGHFKEVIHFENFVNEKQLSIWTEIPEVLVCLVWWMPSIGRKVGIHRGILPHVQTRLTKRGFWVWRVSLKIHWEFLADRRSSFLENSLSIRVAYFWMLIVYFLSLKFSLNSNTTAEKSISQRTKSYILFWSLHYQNQNSPFCKDLC